MGQGTRVSFRRRHVHGKRLHATWILKKHRGNGEGLSPSPSLRGRTIKKCVRLILSLVSERLARLVNEIFER